MSEKLHLNKTITVVSPALSLRIINQRIIDRAKDRLNEIGFCIKFADNVYKLNSNFSSSVNDRILDFNHAISDPKTDIVLSSLGGSNSIEILDQIDLIQFTRSPKIVCGYSDITSIVNFIYLKTGVITYLGPHFSSFAAKQGINYVIDSFLESISLMSPKKIVISEPNEWFDGLWYKKNGDYQSTKRETSSCIFREGGGTGIAIGGHLTTFVNLLKKYPGLLDKKKSYILFIEEDDESNGSQFRKQLKVLNEILSHITIEGIVIGRFQDKSMIGNTQLLNILHSECSELNIPIVFNHNFGHTFPFFVIPIGSKCVLKVKDNESYLEFNY